MTANEVEIEVAKHFGWRQNVIVPNVYWGLGLNYEADMVILRPSGWAIEIEIKVTRADIKADLKKHKHNFTNEQSKFRQFYFAVPKIIADDPRIPERAGILAIHEANGAVSGCEVLRPAKLNPIEALRYE